MTMLADNPTAAAVIETSPCYPVPPSGRSPAIDALRAARAGQGLAIGRDGVLLILRRPWLELDAPVTPPLDAYVPFGMTGGPSATLRCGLIPQEIRERILDHFREALPNEAAAFVIWNETSKAFLTAFPVIDEATPSRLVYRPPALPADCHLVCDIHSHGHGPAFFSVTDDEDDIHATKISLVFGRVDHADGPVMAKRLCAAGMFLPLPRSPFSGDHNAA